MLALAPPRGAVAQPSLTPFQQEALKAIYAVLPFERERFALSPSYDPTPVVLYAGDNVAQVTCVSNAAFTILSQANDAGLVAVNVCPEHVTRLRALAIGSARSFDDMLATLGKGAPPVPADKLRAVGLYRERSTLPGGVDQHYLAMILVGHGAAILPTVVVQAATPKLCGEGGNPFALCADPKGTLSAIAQRLLR
jgi:hypothetical protein